ncbi:hypothetical protein BH23VER1_BH23VER1_13410 [soil metagenome]
MEIALSPGHDGGNQDLGAVLEAIPEFARHVGGYVLEGWMKIDPEDAAAFIAGRVVADDTDDLDAADSVAELAHSELAHSRPALMADWVGGLPNGQFRNDAAAALAINWSRVNPVATAACIDGFPEALKRNW